MFRKASNAGRLRKRCRSPSDLFWSWPPPRCLPCRTVVCIKLQIGERLSSAAALSFPASLPPRRLPLAKSPECVLALYVQLLPLAILALPQGPWSEAGPNVRAASALQLICRLLYVAALHYHFVVESISSVKFAEVMARQLADLPMRDRKGAPYNYCRRPPMLYCSFDNMIHTTESKIIASVSCSLRSDGCCPCLLTCLGRRA